MHITKKIDMLLNELVVRRDITIKFKDEPVQIKYWKFPDSSDRRKDYDVEIGKSLKSTYCYVGDYCPHNRILEDTKRYDYTYIDLDWLLGVLEKLYNQVVDKEEREQERKNRLTILYYHS